MTKTKKQNVMQHVLRMMMVGLVWLGIALLPGKPVHAADSTTVEVKGTVSWSGDIESNRPDSVTLHLYQNGKDTGKSVETSKNKDWAFSFGQVPYKDADGNTYKYNIVEDTVKTDGDSYNPSYKNKYIYKYDQLKITFDESSKLSNGAVDIIYNDDGNYVLKYYNGDIAGATTIIPYNDFYVCYFAGKNSNSEYGFKISNIQGTNGETLTQTDNAGGLPSGTPIEISGTDYPESPHPYTINSTGTLWHYTPSGNEIVSIDFTVTNTGHYAEVKGTVAWNNVATNAIPDSVTLHLYQNGNDTGKTTTASKSDWTFTFGNMPTYDSTGEQYTYSVKEDSSGDNSNAYTTSYTSLYQGHTDFDQLKITFDGSSIVNNGELYIVYNDDDNVKLKYYNGDIAGATTIIPYNDFYVYLYSYENDSDEYGFKISNIQGTTGETLTETESGNSLPSGTPIEKSGTDYPESAHPYESDTGTLWHFTPSGTTSNSNWRLTVTNTGRTKINGTVTWTNDIEANRPDSVTLHLYRNGKDTGETATATKDNSWEFAFGLQDTVDADGQAYEYSIVEDTVKSNGDTYDITYDSTDTSAGTDNASKNFTITNTGHYAEVKGTVAWNNIATDSIPDSVTLHLYQNGNDTGKTTTASKSNWTFTFGNMPIYDSTGKQYTYSVKENSSDAYTTAYNTKSGAAHSWVITVTNIGPTKVSGTVTWENDTEANRPDSVTLHLYRNGKDTGKTTTATKDNNWEFTFGLQDTVDTDGQAYEYSIVEDPVLIGDYAYGVNYTPVSTQESINITIANTGYVTLQGTVQWKTDIESIRPDSVTIHLYQNGTDTGKTTTATKTGNWEFSFDQLPPSDANGDAYSYSVQEDTPIVTGNTYTTESTSQYYHKADQLILTFDASSKTDNTYNAYVEIYYKNKYGNMERTDKMGGSTIANSSVVIPYEDFYVYFQSSSYTTPQYGFKFASIKGTCGETLTPVEILSLPSIKATEKSGTDYPETTHNYSRNQSLLWHYTPDAAPSLNTWKCTVTNTGRYIASGTWGTCPWTIDPDGVLTIGAGTGANTTPTLPSWQSYNSIITSVKTDGAVVFPQVCNSLFSGLKNCKSIDLSNVDFSNVTNMHNMFNNCQKLTTLDTSGWNTSNVTNMSYMFNYCYDLQTLDVSKWDTSNVTTMNCMFSNCKNLTTLDVSGWNTSKMTDMGSLFYNCSALTTLNVSGWNTSNVKNMEGMFSGCKNLTTLDVGKWDTGNVKSMYSMFDGCSSLTALDTSGWNTSNVTDMNSMFYGCPGLTSLDVSKWNVSKVTNMTAMFGGCTGLTTLDVSGWVPSSAMSMDSLFYNCSALASLDVSKWNVSNVTDMGGVFYGCSALATLDGISGWDTSKATNMGGVFYGCSALATLDGISGWDTSKATNMYQMFYKCSNLTTLDLSGWKLSNVKQINNMFANCSSLKTLDASGWDTNKVTYMGDIFINCTDLTTLNVSGWNTSNVTDLNGIFAECSSLTTLDMSGWNTSKVTNMNSVFDGCSALTTLDASGLNTSNVTSMDHMFTGCSDLTTLNVSGWDTGKVTNMDAMFANCYALTTLDGISGWNTSNVTNMLYMFDGCSSLTALDLSGWNTSKLQSTVSMFRGCSKLGLLTLGSQWVTQLSSTALPNTDWIKTRDTDGSMLSDKTQYALATSNVTYADTNKAIRVAKNALNHDETNDVLLAGTWKRAAAMYHNKDDDGDETYISQDIISGQKDSSKPYYDSDDDTDEEWVRNGNTWTYTFDVTDDSKTYYVIEDGTDGYTAKFSSTGNSTKGVLNDKDQNASRTDTVTNTKHDFGNLEIKETVSGTDLPDGYADTLFSLTVTLTDRKENALTGILICGDTIFNNGSAVIQASVNKPVTITEIPQGYHYTVSQDDNPIYTKSEDVSGTITTDTTQTAAFTNTYIPAAEQKTGTFVLTEQTTGRYGDTAPDNSYRFEINYSGLNAGTMYTMTKTAVSGATSTQAVTANEIGTASVSTLLKDGETFSCTEVPDGAQYMITEAPGTYVASYTAENNGTAGTIMSPSGANAEENTELSTGNETIEDGEYTNVTFTNEVEKTQNLTLKALTGTGNSTKDAADKLDFTEDTANDTKYQFRIRFYNLLEDDAFSSSIGKIYAMNLADSDDVQAGADADTWTAEKDFELSEGQTVTFNDIPVGTKYIISEINSPCDVQISVDGASSASNKVEYTAAVHQTALETIDYGENDTVTFMNRISEKASLQIVKENNNGDRLPNAGFTLYQVVDGTDTLLGMDDSSVYKGVYDADTDGMVPCQMTTNETGYSNIITGLPTGTYKLVETHVPSGYTKMEDLTFTIDDQDIGGVKKLTVRDNRLTELPNTGGSGTILITAFALLGMTAFTCVLMANKKQRKAG